MGEVDREEEEVVVVGRRTRCNVNVNLYFSLLAREVEMFRRNLFL